MSSAIGLIADVTSLAGSPLLWGLLILAGGLWGMLPRGGGPLRGFAVLVAAAGLAVVLLGLPRFGPWGQQILFWLMAATAVGAAAAAVSARSPVYTAIWFALSLLGVAGLFLLQQAQFLGVATIVVYAGAIVVTFLFVLMLAQPEGRAVYDRISWARFPPALSVLAAALLVALVAWSFQRAQPVSWQRGGELATEQHMARLGTELFARHLVAVEVAGTLLLVALVGAIAIVMHGKSREGESASTPGAGRGAG